MRLKRISLAVLLALGISAALFVAEGKVPRIGVLFGGSPALVAHLVDAFQRGLQERGHVPGKSVLIEYRYAHEKYERLPDLAAELVRLKVDVILAPATPAVHAARRATATIPIVMVTVGDPVGSGFVASLARPGGNVTGTSNVNPELSGKSLQLLRELVPGLARVAVLSNPDTPIGADESKEIAGAARALSLHLQFLEVRDPDEFEAAFAAMTRERAGALAVLVDAMFFSERRRIVELAAKRRLPAIYSRREFAADGGLVSYGPSLAELFRRAAGYVDKILKGARPADLAVEQPTRFELLVNLKSARSLGLSVPPSLLVRADETLQ